MLDASHPFFRPLWLRVLVVGVTCGWALVEVVTGSPGWAIIFGAMGAMALWKLLIAYAPAAPEQEDRE